MGIVTTQNPEYVNHIETWRIIRNVVNGEAHQYIPDIRCTTCLAEPDLTRAEAQNTAYRDCGVFTNYAKQTLKAIVGLMTNQPPILIEVPAALEYIKTDATGNKLKLTQLIQKLAEELVKIGRVAMITDYPRVPLGLSAEAVKALDVKPRMYTFNSEQVINWKVDSSTGIDLLRLITIYKCVTVEDPNDKYKHDTQDQYLVLELDSNGEYCQTTYDQYDKVIPGKETFYPEADGQRLRKIPLSFLGSEDNNVDVDDSPLETIIELNIAHYICSAIYYDNLKKYGRGIVSVTANMDEKKMVKYFEENVLDFSGGDGIYLGKPGGEIKINQLLPAQEAAVAMKELVISMQQQGAHIVEAHPTNIAYDTLRLNMGAKISMLETLANNIEDGILEHFGYCCDFLGVENTCKFQLSREFIKVIADPALMQAIKDQFIAGCGTQEMVNDYNKKVDLIPFDKTNEEIEAILDNENPIPDGNEPINEPIDVTTIGKPLK